MILYKNWRIFKDEYGAYNAENVTNGQIYVMPGLKYALERAGYYKIGEMPKKESITITLPINVLEQIRERSKKENESVSGYVSGCIISYIENEDVIKYNQTKE